MSEGRFSSPARTRLRRFIAPRLLIPIGLVAVLLVALLARRLVLGRDPLWTRIQESGVWRVGMDPSFPPFENLDPASRRMVGLDVDLARAIAAHWGVRAEITGVGFDELLDAAAARRIDAALSALPVVEHRTKEVAFSNPYVEAGIVLAVPVESAITGVADMAGLRVAVEWGSVGDAELRAVQRQLAADLTPVVAESMTEALDAVLGGEADAALVDAVSLALHPGRDRLRQAGPPLVSDPYVIALPANAPDLLAAVNEALASLEADGTLAEIRGRWLRP